MPTNTSHPNFDDFLARVLVDDEAHAAYEDVLSRHRIVDALVRLRNRFGMTQTDVAKAMGIKQPAVSGFETEGSDPRLSTLQRYARAVDASLWVHVVPNNSSSHRVDFYFQGEGQPTLHAHRAEVTDRAAAWARARKQYRHLAAVPDSVPA